MLSIVLPSPIFPISSLNTIYFIAIKFPRNIYLLSIADLDLLEYNLVSDHLFEHDRINEFKNFHYNLNFYYTLQEKYRNS
jgi:hypothetical protein